MGSSNQPWLAVGKPLFRGRSFVLPLTVAAVPVRPAPRCKRRPGDRERQAAFHGPGRAHRLGGATESPPPMPPSSPPSRPPSLQSRPLSSPRRQRRSRRRRDRRRSRSSPLRRAVSPSSPCSPALLLVVLIGAVAWRDYAMQPKKAAAPVETVADPTPRSRSASTMKNATTT